MSSKHGSSSEEDETQDISETLSDEGGELGTLRAEWLTEKKQWMTWKSAQLQDDPLEEVGTIFARTERTIEAALDLILQQLKPLLATQERVGDLQTRILTLATDIDELIVTPQEETFVDHSPPMPSLRYVAQFNAGLGSEIHAGLEAVVWPGPRFLSRQGGVILLQVLLSIALVVIFFRYRHQLANLERWRFVAQRPISAGVFVAALVAAILYESLPDTFTFIFRFIAGLAFARLLGALLEHDWQQRFVYGLAVLWLTTTLVSTLNFPLPLSRLYILVAAFISALCCWRWAAHSIQHKQPSIYFWLLRLGATLFGLVCMTQLWGNAELAGRPL